MLALINSSHTTPDTNASHANPWVMRDSWRSSTGCGPAPSSQGLNTQAPNINSTTMKCRKRHSTSRVAMDYWPTLKLYSPLLLWVSTETAFHTTL
jgi:hypothetical protein